MGVLVAGGQGKGHGNDLRERITRTDVLEETFEGGFDVLVHVADDIQCHARRGHDVRLRAPLSACLQRRDDIDGFHQNVGHAEVWTVEAE